ncbi:MAG: TIGR01777 family protein [Acaryochloridaceae cyanobacterium SU_2_1]|nr:TIGR01777 family protein [Acaryochloridaceae cyanobacterium SU_2_1]
MKVAISGATGFVGRHLVHRLQTEGHEIIALVRHAARAAHIFPAEQFPSVRLVTYQPQASGAWQQAISGCDAVVNLAGEPLVGERWTAARKQEIIDSRSIGTQKIVEAIGQAEVQPSVLINASAIGYYGISQTAEFDETSPSGDDFLAQVCQVWEQAAQAVTQTGTRLVILRLGIVLGQGGALAKMVPPFQFFAGGPLGSGQQWFSWVHLDDLVNLILYALSQKEMTGVFNATAPQPVQMQELCQSLGAVLNRPSWLPVPGIALELLLGEAAQLLLGGQKVMPQSTQAASFQFQYTQIETALRQILT